MIGGSGEKKTLRMVAQYADESNLTCDPADIPRKLEVLAAHCQRLGRDRGEITVSAQRAVCIAPTHERAEADVARFLGERGIDLADADPATRQMIEAAVTIGDPDEVGEKLAAVLDLGVDGLTCSLPANGHDPANVELLGEVAAKLIE
jgi:alkanesulfonate monooxygenase SsuD/methylene tetrahydromethanopterin reductase-like flavin-dependent oxidoreductase (luciferase family)